MDVAVKGITVEFSGILNEESSVELIRQALEQGLKNAEDKTIRLDFSKVKRANSCGILAWYKIVEKIQGSFIYVNVPRWLVEQFNISDFLSEKMFVESIQAHFYCPQIDTHEVVLLHLGKDIPILKNYDDYEIQIKSKDGFDMEMDFEPNEYFFFISRNTEKYRRSYP
jgi:ABC-type transporter Mla MlaB component